MMGALRRVGQILEHSPSNIAQHLHGHRQSRPGQYLTKEAGAGMGATFADTHTTTQHTDRQHVPHDHHHHPGPQLHSHRWGSPQPAFPTWGGGDHSDYDSEATDSETSSVSYNKDLYMHQLRCMSASDAHQHVFRSIATTAEGGS